MKSRLTLLLALATQWCLAEHQQLSIELAPSFGGQPLAFDRLSSTNAHGQALSVTRLDMLFSGFALQRRDGTWLAMTGTYACVRAREGRIAFDLGAVPSDIYSALRFHVGLPPAVNNADAASYPAEHPLNPNVNGLHWSWLGGYVFLAVEGMWRDGAGKDAGYSFHIASDRQLMTVELPVDLDLTSDQRIDIAFDVRHLLGDVKLSVDAASTHSRENDELATRLKTRAEFAFAVIGVTSGTAATTPPRPVVPRGTPYRFTFARTFPMPQLPRDNPLTDEGVDLGRRLFHEPLLSINDQQSCATCHKDATDFSDTGMRFSLGAEGKPGERNTMPLFNLAWKNAFMWDGRAAALREQVKIPVENPIEMHETLTNVTRKLTATETYPDLFEKVFGPGGITQERIGLALEQFMLTLLACDSKFDRAMNGQVELSEEEKRGFALFSTEFDPNHGQFGADCFHCHGGPLFSNSGFANNGLDATFADKGRMLATKLPGDEGKFAVPSLRNVAVTAPYMHDGRFSTLEEVVDHYATGVKRSATLDPNIAKHPDDGLQLSEEDKQALVAFLKALTDSRIAQSVK